MELTFWQNQNWNTNLNAAGASLSFPGAVGSASPPFFDFVGTTNIAIQLHQAAQPGTQLDPNDHL